ncbi:MAG: hypothetical protein V4720_06320 [Pseudomonadota bacterium]
MTTTPTFLRPQDLMVRYDLTRADLDELLKEPGFPAGYRFTTRIIRWNLDDIMAWEGALALASDRAGFDQAQDRWIAAMVSRFLCWRLPEDFSPDGGISFEAKYVGVGGQTIAREPTGTNLFTAAQAEAMLRHLVTRALDEVPG